MSTAIGSHYDPEAHQRHRSTMAVAFSTKSLHAFDRTIVDYAREIMDVIASRGRDGTPVVLSHHTQAYTVRLPPSMLHRLCSRILTPVL